MKTFEIEVHCSVCATVFVQAENESDARVRVGKGGGWWGQTEWQKHTAESVTIEKVVDVDAA